MSKHITFSHVNAATHESNTVYPEKNVENHTSNIILYYFDSVEKTLVI